MRQDEDTFLAEINRVMAERGLKQRRLAMLAGVNPSYVSNWMLGQIPSPEVVLRLAAALHEPPAQWLRAAGYHTLAEVASPPSDFVEITVEGTILAGAGEATIEKEQTTVPATFAREADFFVRVQGDSMEPDFPEGALVAVKKTNRVADGHAVVVQVEGIPVVKIWIDTKRGPVLRSLNRSYSDIAVGDHLIVGVPVRVMYVRDI